MKKNQILGSYARQNKFATALREMGRNEKLSLS